MYPNRESLVRMVADWNHHGVRPFIVANIIAVALWCAFLWSCHDSLPLRQPPKQVAEKAEPVKDGARNSGAGLDKDQPPGLGLDKMHTR